ncbi:unnamed protein product [Spodoptera littoralis]|uniref:Cytochrome n=1 Tax=Spodoptera littoralis TaxID=7109 RepID=A0A9P0I8X9_SPOLI|nr:unnamed protein product [Spodoptera littoralis]
MYVVLGLVLLCFVVLAVWTTWFRQKPDAPPMMPGLLPIIGHAHVIFGDRKLITDPDDCLTLSNICLNKPYLYDFAKDFLNNGLVQQLNFFLASIWRPHRKLLNPSFNQQVVNTFVDEINFQARNIVSSLKNELGRKPFDVRPYFISFTVSVAIRSSLGLEVDNQKNLNRKYCETIDDVFSLYCDRAQKVWLHIDWVFNLSEMKRKQDKLTNSLKNIIRPIIQKRKAEIKTKIETSSFENKSGKFEPVLDQMLQMANEQNGFTDEIIREHLDSFVSASYDTTSSSLVFAMLTIASYPDIQNRIYNEIQEVLPNKDDDFSKQDLPKLVYLEAVIKETLRLYSSVPVIARKLEADVKLKNYTLRANSTCIIGLYSLHRHPLWGPDVNEFKPERWLDPSRLPENHNLFAPFSIGKRNCIGKAFGMLMMKIAIAHIVRQYHISGSIHNMECEFDIMLKPISGHQIGLKLRS